MKRFFMARSLVAATIGLFFSTPSWAFELFPGRLRNPGGLQQFQRVVYNPIQDSYLILYAGDGRALIGHLSTDGIFSNETALSDAIGVTHVNAAFNPDDGTFLVVYRDGSPAEIYGIYITPDGTPIGSSFFVGSGGEPHIDFSPASGRYVVTWEQLGSGAVRYRVIDGDSTSADPTITAGATVGVGLSPGIAYSSGADKFLVVYVREITGARANVYGRFISSNGTSVGGEFVVAGGSESQQRPRVAYAPSTDRFMVMFENWAGCGGGCPHLRAGLLSDTGATVKGFNVAATSGWDTPGWITYNSVTDTFIAGWRSAFSDTNVQGKAGEFSPVDGKLKGPTVLLTDLNAGVEGAASRPDPMSPQATFLWRDGFGGDGVHAGIINLTPPVPDTTPPGQVTDLSGDPTAGGTSVPATAIASTKPTEMNRTTDGSASSYWSSPDRNAITTEFITWDLGSELDVSQVSLLSRSAGNLFPVDYQIQVSTDNVNFTTAFGVTGASVAPGTWVDHPLPSPAARYVKLLITRTRLSGTGKYKAQIAEVEILEAAPGASVLLHWTAPGDDDDVGTATSYELRWSSNPITPANFGSATLLPTPDPSTAGAQESAPVMGFPSESMVFFALKARDEVPNVSVLSNVASVATLGVPPAPVQGFIAETGNSVDLTWQPSGDDGNTGNATSYDIRYSTAPINDSNFDAAASVIVPATSPKPAFETHTFDGLANQTTYFFAIKALDELGNPSLINGGGPVTATTLDELAPAAADDLSVQIGGGIGQKFNAPAIASSGQSSSTTGPAKATDGNPASYWSTPGRAVPQVEFITLDLGAVKSVGRVTLLSRSSGPLFPEDLEIQVSTDNSVFNTVEGATGLPSTPATLHTFDFGPANARYVRIRITKTRLSAGGLYYAQIAEIAVFEGLSIRLLTISWTEPGDDGDSGIASSFDLRYSTSSIGGNSAFNSATQIDGEPAPSGAGSTASFVFEAPGEGVTLHFRMKTLDEAGNDSVLSNEATAAIVVQPPAAVSDLLAFNPTSTSIDLSWTSTGDDGGSGTADAFDIRYSTSPITGGNFGSANPVTGEPAPEAAGSHQQMTVGGLSPSTTYFFAMKVLDETGAASAISNVVSAATDAPDTTAPSNVTDLRGSAPFTVDKLVAPAIGASSSSSSTTSGGKATDGNLSSYWSSAGSTMPTQQWITLDTGASHDIGQVRILSRLSGPLFPQALEIQVSDDNAIFTTVHTAVGLPATTGLWHTFEFPAVSGRYVRVNATTLRKTAGGVYYAQMAEIEVYEATFVPGPVMLQWTAPGDDGPNGTAASYDVRYSVTPINNLTDFNAATAATGEPSPQAAGATESFEVNLAPGTYFFALRTRDEANNPSGLSNVPVIVVP